MGNRELRIGKTRLSPIPYSRFSMPTCRVVHVPMRETQVGQVRERDERAAETDQRRMQGRVVVEIDDDSAEQQRDARYEKPERAELVVTTEADDQGGQRENTREHNETALVLVIGEKRKTERRKRRNDQR